MKHFVIVHDDLCGQGQSAGLADQDFPANFPMGA
jgi:hypothetical protein